MTSEHPVTRREADGINVFDHLDWYGDVAARIGRRDSDDPDVHLEELARVAVVVRMLDSWQAISVHRATLSGASLQQIAEALGESEASAVDRWREWSARQRWLFEQWTAEDPDAVKILSFNAAEHDQVADILTRQLATEGE